MKEIQGFVVEYPLYFLHEEEYLPSVKTREGEQLCVPTKTQLSFLIQGLLPSLLWT